MKLTSAGTHVTVKRYATLDGAPVVVDQYSSRQRRWQPVSIEIIYHLRPSGTWSAMSYDDILVRGYALKKDGGLSAVVVERRPDRRSSEVFEDDWEWVTPLISLLRPAAEMTLPTYHGYEVEF